MQQPDPKEIMILNRIVVYSVIVIFLVVMAIYLLFFSGKTGQYNDYEDYIFGTYIKIKIASKVNTNTVAKAIFNEMKRLEQKYDPYNESSVLYKLNNSEDWVEVDDETLSIIDTSLKLARYTEGAFDPSIGRLIKLWGFDKFTQNQSTNQFKVPTATEIAEAASQSGYQKIAIDYLNKKIKTNGVWIDLGGLLKGYALKRAYQIAKEFDKNCHGFIEAGGQIMILGPKYNKANWVIGIRDPRGQPGENIAIVYMKEGSIATSGDYERFFIIDNVRYHHIIDPKTGYPANKAVSATIISEDPVIADAFSTAAFVLGKDNWLFTRTVFTKYGAEVMIVTPKKEQLRSDRFYIYEVADR
ncbi:lipoprotein [Fervidobacterium riparium]|uniref:FAD:protein FMN transferase n=2 Tax=Fervidobacteriaceae TaxID=1643950 RepID=A0A1M7SIA2_FERGO|nr:lipoprotein [Fervidobacterium riparium]SHN58174.1 thiamine biosynthesis lipoprotein [Fervidobacterium gondwanense DSM 13020]